MKSRKLKSLDYTVDSIFTKYEFEIFATDDKNEIEKNKTIILVDNKDEIDKALEFISNTITYDGFVTVTLCEIYEKFYNSGIWRYKHYCVSDFKEAQNILRQYINNKVFLVLLCNYGMSLKKINTLLEILSETQENHWFSLPIIYKIEKEEYEFGIFYK